MKPSKTLSMPGSTLAEMLVVMVLAGIILTGVFDGFGFFGKLIYRTQAGYETNMGKLSGLYILDELFSSSDSILGDEKRMMFFKDGQCRTVLTIEDSMLMAISGTGNADTIMKGISRPEVIVNRDRPDWTDSLIFFVSDLEIRLGLRYGNNISAELASERLEKKLKDENKR